MNGNEYLNSLGMFGYDLGLTRIRELLQRLGNPAPRRGWLHLAGTNGKGSVGALLESALRTAGFRTGFYSSPHLIEVRERVRTNGRAISADDWNRLADRVMETAESNGIKVTYFEFTTALAALAFAEAGVDFAVWETGMGGRLDATNTVTPLASIITNIAFDHREYLGDTLAAIAGEKAGIVKPGVPVFTGQLPPEAEAVFAACAPDRVGPAAIGPARLDRERRTQCFTLDGVPVELALAGGMQRRNAALAFRVLAYLAEKFAFPLAPALAGWKTVRWPARFERVTDRLVVDGGHNPDGLTALAESLREWYPGERFTFVYGAFRDKDAAGGLAQLAPLGARFLLTRLPAHGRKLYPLDELSALLPPEMEKIEFATPEAALAAAAGYPERTVVAGSLYLAGETLRLAGGTDRVLNLVTNESE